MSTDRGLTARRDQGGPPPAGRSKLARQLLWAALALVLLAAVGIGGPTAWLLVRLSNGPIELGVIEEQVEAAIAEQLGGASVDVGRAFLDTDPERDVVIRLDDVLIRDAQGKDLIRAPQAIVGTPLLSAAFGSITPTSIELIGPQITIRRLADGTISLGIGAYPPAPAPSDIGDDLGKGDADDFAVSADASAAAPESVAAAAERASAPPEGLAFSPLSAFSRGEDGLAAIKQLVVRDARLTVYDDASRSVWRSFDAGFRIHHPGTGLDIDVDAPFTTASGEWRVRLSIQQERAESPIIARAEFDNVVPAEIAARMDVLADLAEFDMPVTGSVAAVIAPEGELRSVDLNLELGAGFLRGLPRLGGAMSPVLVDEGRLVATYDREKTRLAVEQFLLLFGRNRVEFTGAVGPEFDADGRLTAARFDLRTQSLQLAAEDMPRKAVVVRRGLASGRIELEPMLLELDTVSLELDAGRVTLGGQLGGQGTGSLRLQGRVEDLDIDGLVQLWPGPVAPGARAWIASHLDVGRITEGQIDVELSAADLERAIAGLALAEETIAIGFRFAGVTARYLDPLPPIVEGRGSAQLVGDAFVLTLDEGAAVSPTGDRMAVTFGRFAVPTLVSADGEALIGDIDVSIAAPTGAALAALDLDPLRFAREIGVDPKTVGGAAVINIDLSLPLKNAVEFGEVRLQAGATLADLTVPGVFKGIDLEAAKLQIIGTGQGIDAEGRVRLNGVAAEAKWNVRFAGTGRRSLLTMEGEVDAADFARLGVPLGGMAEGRADMRIRASGGNDAFDQIEIDADITQTTISVPAVGWRKEAGAGARLSLAVEPLDNDQIRLKDVVLKGKDVDLAGAIRLDPDGSVFKVDVDRLRIGEFTDVALSGQRGGDGVLRLEIDGRSFDARQMLERTVRGEGSDDRDGTARPTDIAFKIRTVKGLHETDLADATGAVKFREGEVNAINFRGVFPGGRAVDLNFGLGAGETPAVVRIDTAEAGALVRFLGVYRRAVGGTMSVRARGPDSRRLAGVISASGFRVVDEPLIARIVATQAGVSASAARDVTFSNLRLDFARDGGRLQIKDALIAAPAVGASMRGQVDIAGERLGLSGTYVPAYGFNAAFGAIPIVGPILAGRTGEGVVGMTFGVNGPMSNPTITVNPLSAIAPGLLRRFFEFRQQENLSRTPGRRSQAREPVTR